MYCEKCGNQIKEEAKFCTHCGSAVQGLSDERVAVVTQSQQIEHQQPKQASTEKFKPLNELLGLAKWQVRLSGIYNGRLNRRNWLLGYLVSLVVLVVVSLAFGIVEVVIEELFLDGGGFFSIIISIVWIYLYAVYVAYIFSLHVRRFHDRGVSGWASLLFFVPLVNLVTLFYLIFAKSQDTDNQYGSKPIKDEIGILGIVAISLIALFFFGVMSALVLVALGNARDKANDARMKSDVGQLRVLAEVFYDTNNSSYGGFSNCVNNPTVTACGDGEMASNVSALVNDVQEAGGELQVYTTKAEYCISSSLIVEPSMYICADYSGISETSSAGCGNSTACTY